MPEFRSNLFQPETISEGTIHRLSLYSRLLATLEGEGTTVVSSRELSERINFSATQIRRDLAYFGQFGKRGIGYEVSALRRAINGILGVHIRRKVALVGVGNLGSALLGYRVLREHNFEIAAAFDSDVRKWNQVINNVVIRNPDQLSQVVQSEQIEIGIITVPPQAAQSVLNLLVSAGVRAILNFAPARLTVPYHIKLRNVDLSIELEGLSYFLQHEWAITSKSSV
jgi:redox-sensing transcriptional repressor